MAIMKTSDWGDILDPAASEIFYSGMIQALEDGGFTAFCDVREASTLTVEAKGFGGVPAYAAHTEGNDYAGNSAAETFNKTFTMTEASNSIFISALASHFWDGSDLARIVLQMGLAAGDFMNASAFTVLTGGHSVAGPDGSFLYASDHPLAAGTADNALHLDLDHDALATAFAVARNQVQHHGIPAPFNPSVLVVPPALEQVAKQIAGSQYTSSGLQVNVLGPGLTVVVSPEITDNDSWHLLGAPGAGGSSFIKYVAKGPSPRMQVDSQSDNLQIVDRLVQSDGYTDWRGAVGSAGAS